MPTPGYISLRGVSKHFGAVRAVDGIDLDIAEGEFFALLGPSGCGKTTLLRMLAGFEIPSHGEIQIDGEATASVPPYRRPVNMVFQNYAIFPHLNVFQNIAFGLRKERLPRPELERRVAEALALIKLEGYGSRASNELSGGQRQRVALARALIKHPKVLLLDEPLGALDKKLREQMQLELRQLQRDVGITFVFVTHDQEEALTMSDRMAVMESGRVLEVGSPADLYERPGTRFVAEFLGSMNFFQGKVRSRKGSLYSIETDRLGMVEAERDGVNFNVGDDLTVALRPENIRITAQPGNPEFGAVEGTIGATAFLGDRAHVYVKPNGAEEPLLVAVQNLDGQASSALREASRVSLGWSRAAVLLFDRD